MNMTELANIINTMDLPERRKELTANNARWLLRNLRVRNAAHPQVENVINALKELAK